VIIGRPKGTNVVAGEEQGYQALPMRVQEVRTQLSDGRVFDSPGMITMWIPTENERTAILAGEPVFVRILGKVPPPMAVGVGDPDEYGW
jgi:hypothetical protein